MVAFATAAASMGAARFALFFQLVRLRDDFVAADLPDGRPRLLAFEHGARRFAAIPLGATRHQRIRNPHRSPYRGTKSYANPQTFPDSLRARRRGARPGHRRLDASGDRAPSVRGHGAPDERHSGL